MVSEFVCHQCKSYYNSEVELPQIEVNCPKCDIPMINTGVIKSDWDKMTADQKRELKTETLENYHKEANTKSMTQMAKDIGTIKDILIFYLVASIIAGILIAVL